jgi:hypothetical protein
MNNKKCTNCGLVNYMSTSACTRCGQAFSASPYVDAVVSNPGGWQGGPQFGHAPYPPTPPYAQHVAGQLVDKDAEHLRLLSVFHYVVGSIIGLMACFPIIHLVVGIGLLVAGASAQDPDNAPPAFLGLIFIAIASTIILAGWTVAGCAVAAGRFITQRRRHTFCVVVACVLCLFMPLGAILGVFSIVVLNRASVKALFR